MSTDVGQLAWAQAIEQMTGSWVQADNMAQQRGSAQHQAGYRSGYNKAVQDMRMQMNKLQNKLHIEEANVILAQEYINNYRDALIQARGQKWFNENKDALTAKGQKAYRDYLVSRGFKVS